MMGGQLLFLIQSTREGEGEGEEEEKGKSE